MNHKLNAIFYRKRGEPKDGDFDYLKHLVGKFPNGKYIIELHKDYIDSEVTYEP